MSEDTKDPIKMKKDILSNHIPFIQKMLEKVKNTEFEKKWQQMYDCIMSDKKKLNLDQISKMNKTILGLKCKMQQIEPKKENIQLKTEQIESPIVKKVPMPKAIIPIKTESQVNCPKSIINTQILLENPPLSNDDITQLLVETAESTTMQPATPVEIIPKDNVVGFGKLNCNEAETMESIEGFMKHIHGQDSIKKVNEIVPSTSKKVISEVTRNDEKLKDASKSQEKKSSDKLILPKPTSSSILLPSPSFENAISSVELTKGYKIPKLSKANNSSKVASPVLPPSQNKKHVMEGKPKRRISSSSTDSTKSDEPSQKKLKTRKRNVILDSESSDEDNKIVKTPVKSKNDIVKEKESKNIDQGLKQSVKSSTNRKDDAGSIKALVEKLPAPQIDVAGTSALILSLENLVGKLGLKKMKSIFVQPADDVKKDSSTCTNVEETVKRRLSNVEKNSSAKKQKVIEKICNDVVVKKEVTSSIKRSPKKRCELDRLNEDIDNMFIRDGVLKATGKRACTVKSSIEEISLRNYEKMRQLKKCSVLLHRLELNMNDKPFNINNFPRKNISVNVSIKNEVLSVESVDAKVAAKDDVAKRPKVKRKVKKYIVMKNQKTWTRLACKQQELKDEEWEDVEDDHDDSKVPLPTVSIEQNVAGCGENIKNIIESVNKELTTNSESIKAVILEPSAVPISNSITPSSSSSSNKGHIVVDSISNNKSKFVMHFKKVCNLSYASLSCGIVYKCTCGDCRYQTILKPSFLGHLNENHMSLPWNGYCELCQKTVEIEQDKLKRIFIINEFIHMFQEHILHEKRTAAAGVLKNAGNSKDPLGFVNSPTFMPKITVGNGSYGTNTKTIGGSIVGKIIPMVKIPMNYIMATNQQKDNKLCETKENNVEKLPVPQCAALKQMYTPSTVIKTPASSSWTQTVINAQQLPIPPVSLPTIIHAEQVPENITYVYDSKRNEMLRPWLPSHPLRKSRTLCMEMLSEICLVATFKCMATTCSYYTNDEKYFRMHLKAHLRLQLADKSNFTKCSYCPFLGLGIDSLVAHIKCTHKYDRFQCPYCFYRTVVDFNVLTHMDLYHKMKPKMVIECNLMHAKNYIIELETIKKTRVNFVPPIVCVFCKLKFYVFQTFISHVNSHTELCNTKCIKCNETTNKMSLHKHLVKCHGFGLFQCVYCKYGTNTFEIINHHLTNFHPTKLPMFCERTQSQSAVKIPVSSIDSTCLKHINQIVNSNLIKKPVFPDAVLANHENVGKLAKNLVIQKISNTNLTAAYSEGCDGNSILFEPLENDPKILSSHEAENPEPSTSQKPNGECKLQIQRVYSLFDETQFK